MAYKSSVIAFRGRRRTLESSTTICRYFGIVTTYQHRSALPRDAEFFHAGFQGGALHPQEPGRPTLPAYLPAGPLQHLDNVLPFQLGQCREARRVRGCPRCRQPVAEGELRALAEDGFPIVITKKWRLSTSESRQADRVSHLNLLQQVDKTVFIDMDR